jgi:TnpA family transposase
VFTSVKILTDICTPSLDAVCTYTQPNPTRRAIFEFEKLVRSLYTLRYLRDPQLQRDVHRSQNRIESYHQLRSAIAQVSGKKELTI